MEIRFISTLTTEDEARVAITICKAAEQLLAPLSIAYTLRVRTTDGQLFSEQSPGLAGSVTGVVSSEAAATAS